MADPNYPQSPQAPGFPVAPQPYDPNFNPNLNPDAGRAASTGEAPLVPTASADIEALHSEAEEEYLNNLYAELKPVAFSEFINYFLARTPAHLQQDMKDLILADFPAPPPEAGEDPETLVRVQGEQGKVSVQKPAISDKSPQVALAGQNVDRARGQLDTNLDRNRSRSLP